MGERLTDVFLQLFCEKNSDGTKNLRLKGCELYQRIKKRLVAKDMHKLANFLNNHPEIINVDFCYNNLGDEGIKILSQKFLTKVNYIQHLNLIGCSLGGEAMESLYLAAETLKLISLRVNGNNLGNQGGKFVGMYLVSCPTLEHLDVADSSQTVDSIRYLLYIIREDIGSPNDLKVLDISRVVPTSTIYQYNPEDHAINIGLMLKTNTKLVELHIQKSELDGHDVEYLVEGLARNKTLKFIDMAYNHIGDYGLEILAEYLKTKPQLLGLNIAGNAITDIGASALSFGMPFSKIRLLDISSNKITDKGLSCLFYTLKKPYVMQLFYIWGNAFGLKTNKIVHRMLQSGVLQQEGIDIRLYEVDGVLKAAYYPSNRYKHKYYCVMDHGCAVELKIKKNKLEQLDEKQKVLLDFKFYKKIIKDGRDGKIGKIDDGFDE